MTIMPYVMIVVISSVSSRTTNRGVNLILDDLHEHNVRWLIETV